MPVQTAADVSPSDDAPLRSELLSTDRLEAKAREVASAQSSTTTGRVRTTPLIDLCARAAASLHSDYSELASAAREQGAAPPAAEYNCLRKM